MRRWPVQIGVGVALAASLHAGVEKPPRLDPNSEPTAVLHSAYNRDGWSSADALALTKRAISRLKGEEVAAFEAGDETDADVDVCIDPESAPSAVLFAEFRESGWAAEDAATQAMSMVAKLTGAEPAPQGEAMGPPMCLRVPVALLICDGAATKRRLTWVTEPAWRALTGETDGEEGEEAPAEGEDRWRLVSLDCTGAECAWVSDLGVGAVWTPCEWASLKAGCVSALGETTDLEQASPCERDGCAIDGT